MEKMAATLGRKAPPTPALAPNDDLPPEYWRALLEDARAETMTSKSYVATRRLTEIPQHLLRVDCRRCSRTVEIQKVDAIRLYGERAIWKGCRPAAVGQYLHAADGASRGRRLLAVLRCALNAIGTTQGMAEAPRHAPIWKVERRERRSNVQAALPI
jgi:hypothetical protein